MSKKYKKHHTFSVFKHKKSKVLFPQIRESSVFKSFGIRVLSDIDIYQKQILQYKAIIVKILKAANKETDSYLKKSYYAATFVANRVLVKIYPYVARSAKSQGSRMGKGKGAVQDYYWPTPKGSIIFEISACDQKLAEECLLKLQPKVGAFLRLVRLYY